MLAHLSDLHATPVRVGLRDVAAFSNKRAAGWLSWQVARRREHRPEILDALVSDIGEQAPDHVVVTGDLTNLGLEQELPAAARWLERLGPPQRVSIVPGNHDAYVKLDWRLLWDHWSAFAASDPDVAWGPGPSPGRRADLRAGFPTLRVRGPAALIGLCSARPTRVFDASGALGGPQLAALEKLLVETGARGLLRVVLLHHPALDPSARPRRRLRDGEELCRVLARAGAELVLHGHTHRSSLFQLAGAGRPIPAVGVRSSSGAGRRPGRRAHYHLYAVETAQGAVRAAPHRIRMRVRAYDPAAHRFVTAGERLL